MSSTNIRDVLTAFSPNLDLFAISSGDGRIKIWDTVKGQIQTQFADITASDAPDIFVKPEGGHLSVDYTCMKWWASDKKKKRKHGGSLLLLGTGSGDVLAFDVSTGQLKWRILDCHPGGVCDISFSIHGSCIFTTGADGMICEIDSLSGNLLGKFKASTKSISSLSISSDGKMVATSSAQLKIFSCQDHKKIQKFSGHPGAVRCMTFTDDGNYILSSAGNERYIAIWRVDGSKNKSASCSLAMEHPAVFIDSRCINNEEVNDKCLNVLALSETGVCYFWHGKNIEALRNAVPTKVSVASEDNLSTAFQTVPSIFAAKLLNIGKAAAGHIFVAHGLLVKPLFQKIVVPYGTDLKLKSSQDGILLPASQSLVRSKKGQDTENKVTALDRANAEDALVPISKIIEYTGKKEAQDKSGLDPEKVMAEIVKARPKNKEHLENGTKSICMEDQLRSHGFLNRKIDVLSKSRSGSAVLDGVHLDANISQKKMRAAVLSKSAGDAFELLENLVAVWESRSADPNVILPWINCILVNHSNGILSQKAAAQMLQSLSKTAKARKMVSEPLLVLAGRLQLVIAQIEKATENDPVIPEQESPVDESDDGDDDDVVDDIIYGEGDDDDVVDDIIYGEEDDESQLSSEADDE